MNGGREDRDGAERSAAAQRSADAHTDLPADVPLGRPTDYPRDYAPERLVAVPRGPLRERLGIGGGEALPFAGVDVWTAWELSWLDSRGRPHVAVARLEIPADSPALVESKSLKLYLNGFASSVYDSGAALAAVIAADVGGVVGAEVRVGLERPADVRRRGLATLPGVSLDDLEVTCSDYHPRPALLIHDGRERVREVVHSELLRSLCPVTGQPDWGAVVVEYEGRGIDHASLLCYLVSLREHQGFHEESVERIFLDLIDRCGPERLVVQAFYLRRGGLDIDPLRATEPTSAPVVRAPRQ